MSQIEFETRLVDNLNKDCAKRRHGIFLRVPKQHPYGNYAFCQFEWQRQESELYLSCGILPINLDSIHPESTMIALWIFSTNAAVGPRLIPEIDIAIPPDFKNQPALCLFDMGKDRFRQQQVALVPSEFLEPVPTYRKSVQWILREGKTIEYFTTNADFKSLVALEAKILGLPS